MPKQMPNKEDMQYARRWVSAQYQERIKRNKQAFKDYENGKITHAELRQRLK